MNIDLPENARLLGYLTRRHPSAPLLAGPASAADPYYQLGSHPDIVERVWQELQCDLPVDCRQIVCGTPALVQPETGIVFAIALGTQYALCLPGGLAEEALRAGARTTTRWAGGKTLDIRQELGEEWIFGRFLRQEPDWLVQSFFNDPVPN